MPKIGFNDEGFNSRKNKAQRDYEASGANQKQRASEAQRILEQLDESALTTDEADFVTGLIDRFEKYGDQTFVSPKQLFWLRDIHGRQ
jgi:hypothetical protein